MPINGEKGNESKTIILFFLILHEKEKGKIKKEHFVHI